MVEKEYNLEFATSMVHQFMPGFSSQKNAIILCDSGYIKQNFVSILSSKCQLNRRRVSLSTLVSVLMSVLFIYHNLTILLKASNSILDEIAHAILLKLIHI